MVNCKNILLSRASLYAGGATAALCTGLADVFKHTYTEAAIKTSELFGQFCQQLPSSEIIPQLGNITCQVLENNLDSESLISSVCWFAENAGVFIVGLAFMSAWNYRSIEAKIMDLTGVDVTERAPLIT